MAVSLPIWKEVTSQQHSGQDNQARHVARRGSLKMLHTITRKRILHDKVATDYGAWSGSNWSACKGKTFRCSCCWIGVLRRTETVLSLGFSSTNLNFFQSETWIGSFLEISILSYRAHIYAAQLTAALRCSQFCRTPTPWTLELAALQYCTQRTNSSSTSASLQ